MTHDPKDSEWDRSQWAEEGDAKASDATDDATWDRHQMETDDAGEPRGTSDDRDAKRADDSGPLSGRGETGGESHWDRVED